jgi:hypothetical protein
MFNDDAATRLRRVKECPRFTGHRPCLARARSDDKALRRSNCRCAKARSIKLEGATQIEALLRQSATAPTDKAQSMLSALARFTSKKAPTRANVMAAAFSTATEQEPIWFTGRS